MRATLADGAEPSVLTLSVIDGRQALDGVVVEDDRPQGFKAPERPPISFALAPVASNAGRRSYDR